MNWKAYIILNGLNLCVLLYKLILSWKFSLNNRKGFVARFRLYTLHHTKITTEMLFILPMSVKLIKYWPIYSYTLVVYGIFYFWSGGGDIMKNKVSKYTHSKKQLDDYSNQKNKNNRAYIARMNNRANQLNPNNFRYCLCRKNNK